LEEDEVEDLMIEDHLVESLHSEASHLLEANLTLKRVGTRDLSHLHVMTDLCMTQPVVDVELHARFPSDRLPEKKFSVITVLEK
jgi:hypothetical protein